MPKFDIAHIDSLIHGRLRLGIMAILASSGTATFSELKTDLKATQGNLSIQLKKLENAGYIKLNRKLKGKKTETTARLTKIGKSEFLTYLTKMETLINTNKA